MPHGHFALSRKRGQQLSQLEPQSAEVLVLQKMGEPRGRSGPSSAPAAVRIPASRATYLAACRCSSPRCGRAPHRDPRRPADAPADDRRRQCAGCRCQLGIPGAERRICAQEAYIGHRIPQQGVAALEALGQLVLLRHRLGQAVSRSDVEAVRLCVGPKPGDRILHRLHGFAEAIPASPTEGIERRQAAEIPEAPH